MSSETNQYQENESEGKHVDEESFYESQLACRLGSLPNWVSGVADEVISRKIVYSEDFAFDNDRGFSNKIITNGGQVDTNIFRRVSDVPDLADSNNLFEDSVDRETNRIPEGSVRSQRTIATTGNNGSTNFPIEAYAIFTTLNLSNTNPNINVNHTHKYASFWSHRRFGQGDIATISMQVSTDYNPPTVSFENATWITVPLHSGKFGNSTSDDQKFVKGMVDLTPFANGINGNNVTLALKYQGSSSTYSGSNRNGTFYFSDLQFIAQTAPITNTWCGSSNSYITEPANWDTKAAPVSTTNNLLIPAGIINYPTTTNPLTVNTLIIESGASFSTTSTVTGNVTYKRNLSFIDGNTNGCHLVGSPVNGQLKNDDFITANSIASGNGNNRGIAAYNNTVSGGDWTYFQQGNSEVFDVGKGYSIKTYEDKEVSFTGTMNTGNVNIAITKGASYFNLISNPYTSFINSGTFLNLPTNADKLTSKTIWVWNPITKNYETKIAGSEFKIAPVQAFFVSCKTAGNLTFEEDIQIHQNTDAFLKSEPKPEIQLNITDGILNRFAKIYYSDESTKGFDNGFDGETFETNTNVFDAFTQLLKNNSGKNYQIQSLPNQDLETMVIPVGIKADAGKEITFTVDALNLSSGINVFLEDKLTANFTRLDKENDEYKIQIAETLNGIGRFYLHTKSAALSVSANIFNSVSVYKVNSTTLKVSGLQDEKANFSLYTVLGKEIINQHLSVNEPSEITLPRLVKGVYMVQVTSALGTFYKKIILD